MEDKSLIYKFDGVCVEVAQAQAFRDGRRLAIEPKAFRVLVYLLERRGLLVRKEELRAAVWAETYVTENAVARAVAVLRRALGDNKEEPKYIQTVPTLGYRFVAEVEVEEPKAATLERVVSSHHSWWLRAAIAVAIVVVLALVWGTPSAGKGGFRSIQVTSSLGLDIDPTFSPDGNTLAFASDQSGSFEIYAKDLAGATARRLTSDGQRNLQPAWSPDGSMIVYYSQGQGGLWLMPSRGGSAHRLTPFGASPAWSPDGREIVFQSGGVRDLSQMATVSVAASNLWIVRVADGAVRPLTRINQPEGAHNSPAWSPGGRSVAFVVNSLSGGLCLWQVTVESGRIERIPETAESFEPAYDRSGRSLLAGSTRTFGIWELPLGRIGRLLHNPRHLLGALPGTSMDRYVAMSRDGRHIAFSRVATSSNLYALRLDAPAATGPVAVTADTRSRKSLPAISPDGSRVLFSVSSAEPGSGTWVANLDGSDARLVASRCRQPQWLGAEDFACTSHASIWKVHLPSGVRERIGHVPEDAEYVNLRGGADSAAYMASDRGAPNIWLAGLRSGETRQLTFDPELAGFPAWSPDGRELAVEVKRGDSTNVYTLNSAGALQPVTHDSGENWPYGWSPDGRRIAFAGMRGGVWNVWWAARDGSREEQLTHYEGPRHYVRYPAWSPAGNAIVYEYGETRGNIWMLERR